MHQIYGAVEIRISNDWYETINVSSLLLSHADLNGCLFGVDNYAGYAALFPDRGLPADCSETLRARLTACLGEDSHPSWALWSELTHIDWGEPATRNDERVSELAKEGDVETVVTKWLNEPRLAGVRETLDRDANATVQIGQRIFRRLILKRRDCLTDTDFPLVMNLMGCLAKRFGDDAVRLTVWFG